MSQRDWLTRLTFAIDSRRMTFASSDPENPRHEVTIDDRDALQIANGYFTRLVERIDRRSWDLSTPCTSWSVRDLVRHVIDGHARMYAAFSCPPARAEVTASGTPDLSLARILGAWIGRVSSVIEAPENASSQVRHHVLGEMSAASYARVRWIDVMLHSWDLSQAIEVDFRPKPDMTSAALEWFKLRAPDLAASGAFAPPKAYPETDVFALLLSLSGRVHQPNVAT